MDDVLIILYSWPCVSPFMGYLFPFRCFKGKRKTSALLADVGIVFGLCWDGRGTGGGRAF